MASKGRLKIQCFNGDDYIPVDKCKVSVRKSVDSVDSTNQTTQNFELTTNNIGLTDIIELDAPPVEYSLNENSNQVPYSLYDIRVERSGFETLNILGCQIFSEQVAYQRCNLINNGQTSTTDVVDIQANTLNGNFPPKIPEEVDKPLPKPTSGVVLAQPVVPEYIVVHQGSPNDASAPNYKVPYKEYIKNVASCEIYSTWPESTIRANVFCIVSFTLNRIYTEWYRGKGKNFDITSSTAYDHAFDYGRNIYESISQIVDELFSTYIRRIGKKQPLLTQYCDGKKVNCPEWLSQWGSKDLGSQGRLPYEILQYYYGNDIELTTAQKVQGSPQSYPGYNLTVGSQGRPVKMIQEQINKISVNYPLIPKVSQDGNFTQKMADSIKVFQSVFNLPQTGSIDYATWYKISDVYVGVSKIAELRCSVEKSVFIPPVIPNFGDEREVPKFYY
ncbi:peptidoglycan-binding domain-containing protein [Clostridium sp. SM-530-WT-3G]|uniref:peptidoglycan-binding domain-containing protein n=1 Tax=Clostridium sp. SM-530-WT-3G TaxID=2725303 RepID=UPI00145E0D2C|nr:peptidoglycan-binding domain-containing protein [Clostridium sp. SM-530-WT-3G]NME82300.1 peptidoglycan-binding protein [Clostridium sp. SM-530-WT-3G]